MVHFQLYDIVSRCTVEMNGLQSGYSLKNIQSLWHCILTIPVQIFDEIFGYGTVKSEMWFKTNIHSFHLAKHYSIV